MAQNGGAAWRCGVCGYVHRGSTPPDNCPVCGAPAAEFGPFSETLAVAPSEVTTWRCLNCHYVHDGSEPPKECPVCGVSADQFEPVATAAAPAFGAGEAFRTVIVGAGIAAVSAAEAIRNAAPRAEITLIASEGPPPYYRLNLTRYLAGEIDTHALPIHPLEWYKQNRITLVSGARTETLDLEGRRVIAAGGGEHPFERLILATGAHAFIPPIPGADREGVVTLRTTEDAERILAAALRGDPVVVIGGGVLSLETAGALAHRGADVTLLEGHEWLMPRQLDREAGELLGAHVARIGIRLERRAQTREIAGEGRASRIELADGRSIPAALVVLATGVRPNTHLARRAGLQVNQGVVVHNSMASSAAEVYAAGDVAEHNGVLYGTLAASQYQGSIAGMNAAGLRVSYGGRPRSNTLKVLGLELMSVGQFSPLDRSFAVVDDRSGGRYLRFVLQHGVLVGAILFGDTSAGLAVKAAIEGKLDCSGLLLGAPSAADLLRHLAQANPSTRAG